MIEKINDQNKSNGSGISIKGGAAILAPIQSFPNGVPNNALVLLPLNSQGQPELEKKIVSGPVALQMEDVWKLLGFNGPAVQVQDEQGRPLVIGLEDLLSGLEKHWNEGQSDLSRGRIFAQELLKHQRWEKAETVLSKVVAKGGNGEDWLALGVAQLNQEKYDKAEGTLKGAQNLLKDNPYPSLHLAKCAQGKKDVASERAAVERALQISPQAVDAWAYMYDFFRRNGSSEEQAMKEVEDLAALPAHSKLAAPYIALQGFYASSQDTRNKAIELIKKGLARAPQDALALLVLSALYGQAGQVADIVKLLAPHEALMQRDVRLANNYFEALFQMRDVPKITQLLNKLATSQSQEVKQFAIERSRAMSQMLAQQQAALQTTAEVAKA